MGAATATAAAEAGTGEEERVAEERVEQGASSMPDTSLSVSPPISRLVNAKPLEGWHAQVTGHLLQRVGDVHRLPPFNESKRITALPRCSASEFPGAASMSAAPSSERPISLAASAYRLTAPPAEKAVTRGSSIALHMPANRTTTRPRPTLGDSPMRGGGIAAASEDALRRVDYPRAATRLPMSAAWRLCRVLCRVLCARGLLSGAASRGALTVRDVEAGSERPVHSCSPVKRRRPRLGGASAAARRGCLLMP